MLFDLRRLQSIGIRFIAAAIGLGMTAWCPVLAQSDPGR